MEINFKQSELCAMMMAKIMTLGEWDEGTYNRQDPTHYARGKAAIHLQCGYQHVDDGYPEEETVDARFNDVTWGVEFQFHTSLGTIDGYFDRDTEEWCRCHPRFFEVFKDLMLVDPPSLLNRRETMAELRRYE